MMTTHNHHLDTVRAFNQAYQGPTPIDPHSMACAQQFAANARLQLREAYLILRDDATLLPHIKALRDQLTALEMAIAKRMPSETIQ